MPLLPRKMAHTNWLIQALTRTICWSALIGIVTAAPEDGTSHIRTTDSRLRRLVHEGASRSPTFRALVDRIERSDVVVYLRCEGDLASNADARLTFVSSAGGYRYVLVRLRLSTSPDHQLAIIGHELQHAAEIADAPAIVDSASMAREYRKIGYVNIYSSTPGIAFDSDAAIQTGHRVLRELSTAAAD